MAGATMRVWAQAAADAATEQVRGVVIDAITKQPIGRALVVSSDQRLARMTDSEGRFEFDVAMPAGRNAAAGPVGMLQAAVLVLSARKPGYLQTFGTPVQMGGRAKNAEVRIALVPEAIVVGTVATSESDTPKNVTVNLMHRQVEDGLAVWVQMQSKQTNSRGEFRFADLAAGSYRVATAEWMERGGALPAAGQQLMGYPPAHAPAEGGAGPGALEVKAGETVQANLNLRAEPYYQVRVAVQGLPQGEPFSLDVRRADGGTGFSLGLNAQSHMIEGSLPNGAYDVRLESYAQTHAPVVASAVLTVAGRPLEASIAAATRGVTPVTVREEYTSADTTGRVNEPPEQQRRPVDVMLLSASGDRQMTGMRETPGRSHEGLVLEGARPGRYHVVVTPHRGYVATVRSGGVDLLHEDLVIGSDGTAAPIEITLRDDTATVHGTVTAVRATGASASGALGGFGMGMGGWLVCVPEGHDAERFIQSWIGTDGQFNVEGIPPGQYRVLGFRRPPQELEYRNPEAMRQYDSAGVLVTLTAGQRAEIVIPALADGEE